MEDESTQTFSKPQEKNTCCKKLECNSHDPKPEAKAEEHDHCHESTHHHEEKNAEPLKINQSEIENHVDHEKIKIIAETNLESKSKCRSQDSCHKQPSIAETKAEVSKCCASKTCKKQPHIEELNQPVVHHHSTEGSGCSKDKHHHSRPIESHEEKPKCCSKESCKKSLPETEAKHKEPSKCCSKDSCHKKAEPVEVKHKENFKCCSKGACHQIDAHKGTIEENHSILDIKYQPSSDRLIFKIEGMCCASEIGIIKEVLNPLIQGKDTLLSFDLINSRMILENKSTQKFQLKIDDIIKAISKTGMSATLWTEHLKKSEKTFWEKNGRKIMNLISAICFIIGLAVDISENGADSILGNIESENITRPDSPAVAAMVFYSICIFAGGFFIFPKALIAVKRLKPNTKLLTVLATAGAIAINEWFEAAISMYLFSAAELLEAWNMERARKSIRMLMELAPSTANIIKEDGSIHEDSVDKIPVGATLLIKPGEKIPMDSVLISEFTTVNQAPITGESLPVQKEAGDALFAGTINGDLSIKCRVTKAASDSTLASIIKKVEEAQSNRANSDQWIENFALYYVPFMMFASIVVIIIPPLVSDESWNSWIYKGLELLVISCPCSLIISTPVSIVAGITAAARSGVLIKGGIHLENAAALKAFAMDKTGTITTGEPVVHDIISLDGFTSEKELLKLAVALEVHSDHPLARAIQRKAKADDIQYQSAEQFRIFKGKGAEGIIQDKLYWIGSHRFLHEKIGDKETTPLHEKIKGLESAGQSIVVIGHDIQICGLITIADSIRPQSKNAIQAIKRAGIQRIVMLTGDSQGAAKVIAESIKIDEYQAELLPEDKVTSVKALVKKYKNIAMVGDGVNDAPAMAASMLGIAMGTAGSDTAIETADIALMADDLDKLAWLVNHSRHTLTIIKQNVVFSLLVKLLFAALTFANRSSLWLAIVADMGTTFLVVSNSLRLVKSHKQKKVSKKYEEDQGVKKAEAEKIHIEKSNKIIENHNQRCCEQKKFTDLEKGKIIQEINC